MESPGTFAVRLDVLEILQKKATKEATMGVIRYQGNEQLLSTKMDLSKAAEPRSSF